MAQLENLIAEFDAIGEAEVSNRLHDHAYEGAERALAMRWLNERTLHRVDAVTAEVASLSDIQLTATRRAESAARMSMLCACLAMLIALGSLGVSVQAMRMAKPAAPAAPAAAAPVAAALAK